MCTCSWGQKGEKNGWWSFLAQPFFFFFYTQAGPPEDIIHCMCVWEGGEQGK